VLVELVLAVVVPIPVCLDHLVVRS